MFFLCLDIWASQDIIRLESQSVSLDNSGKPLSSVNIQRLFPNFPLQLGGYLSPPTRLPAHCRITALARVPQACITNENSIIGFCLAFLYLVGSLVYGTFNCIILYFIPPKTKLRRLGLMNLIVHDSDSKLSKFEHWNPSNSKSDVEIGFQLKDDVKILTFLIRIRLNSTNFWSKDQNRWL